MAELLQRQTTTAPFPGAAGPFAGDERLARAELRRQIGRLEQELAGLVAESFPLVVDASVPVPRREPRVLGLGELEAVRDALAARVSSVRRELEDRALAQAENRALLQRMLEAPADHRWLRISRDAVGEPGCGHWHSRPRFGLLGMLMGWWRVKISSGCPL
jgi:hypothetical protein